LVVTVVAACTAVLVLEKKRGGATGIALAALVAGVLLAARLA
jgi:hypothetical protein